MNPRGLAVFVAVNDEGSFARAGELLYLSPSGVSGIVRALERELGVTLFRRHGRGAEPTDAAMALLPYARAALAAMRSAQGAVHEVTAGLRGRVTLGIMQAMRAPAPDPALLLSRFGASHPGVEVRVRHGGGSMDMVTQVASGRLDLALVGAPTAPPGVHLRTLFTEPIDLVCAATHRLAGRSSVELAELSGELFAELPPAWGSRVLNDLAFTARGIGRTVRHEINDVATLLTFVANDLAVTLLPRSMVHGVPGTVRLIVADQPQPFRVSLATPGLPARRTAGSGRPVPAGRELEPAAQALADHILAAASGTRVGAPTSGTP